MTALKTVGRVVLVVLMIPTVIQLALAVMGLVAAASQHSDAISYMMGRLIGTLLFLMLFIWLFRKLGEKR